MSVTMMVILIIISNLPLIIMIIILNYNQDHTDKPRCPNESCPGPVLPSVSPTLSASKAEDW